MIKFLCALLIAIAVVPAQANTVTLTPENTVNLVGPVTSESVNKALMDIIMLDLARKSCKDPLYLVINSPGGSVYYGNRFILFARTVCNLNTVTLFGASMASAIAMQLPGKRYATDISEFMFHRAYVEIGGQVEDGELESRLKHVKRIIRHLEWKNSRRIGITLKEYKKRVKDEWWVYGYDAVKLNVADELVNVVCSKELQTLKEKRTYQSLFGAVTVEASKCPLL